MPALRRYDGDDFKDGGVLRAWTGDGWNPPLGVTPNDLDAVFWMSSDDMSGSDGAPITGLVDRSGNGSPVTLHGTPVFRGGGMNGVRCIEFSPGSWATIASTLLDLGDDFTISTVIHTLPGNGDGMAWMFGEAATFKRRALWCQGQSSANMSGYDANVISGAPTGAACVITVTRISGYVTIRRNGTLVASGSPGLAPYTFGGFALGANVSGSEPYTGRMAELAAFTDPLTADDAALLEAAWLVKYGI